MSWQWATATVLLCGGAVFAYLAGANDAQKQLEQQYQREVWRDANNSAMGTMDDVPGKRDRDNTPGNAA
jgi:hypothetical protein